MGAALDTALLARITRNPGRLVLGPTTKSGGLPYGGKTLGYVRELRLEVETHYQESRDPSSKALLELGRRGVEVYRLYCVIEGPA